MVVLLIGGESSLMDALITKLNKDRHTVYLLTGQKNTHSSYKRVFEKYNFLYSSENVKDIITSIQPDTVIYTGAFDTNYNWSSSREESVRYTSDFMNLMTAFSLLKKGRFIYFSSYEVFENTYAENIQEDEPTSTSTFRSMAIAQGEELCRSYRKNLGLDTMILRFDHLYALPQKNKKENNLCFKQCLEALKTGKIQANERKRFSMIYLNDAVEYVYQIIMRKKPEFDIYNITSMEEITERDLAELIKAEFGSSVEIVNSTAGDIHRIILDGSRYRKEFPAKIFVPYEKGTAEYVRYMKKNKSAYLNINDRSSGLTNLWHIILRIIKALIPFIENMICFVPFFMLNNRATGSAYFDRLDFYLIYVLLFAVTNGQQQAVFSAMLSVLGYFFRQTYQREVFDILVDYNTYVWIAQLLIVGLVVGYMKDQLRHINTENEEEIEYMKEQMRNIEDINDSNVRIKHIFENQLVNQHDSLGQVYAITSELDQHQPEEVLFCAAEILSKLMNSKDVAIYKVANEDYARLVSSTSQSARKLGISIKYSSMTDLYNELVDQHVYINKNMNDKYPLMASGIYEQDKLTIIMMLWNIPWERMNLSESNRLAVIGHLTQNKVMQANRYMEAIEHRRYENNSRILNEKEFSRLIKAFFEAKSKHLTECCLLEIITENTYEGQRKTSSDLEKIIYNTDYIGILDDGKLYILLTNTSDNQAGFIIDKIKKCGYDSKIREGLGILC